MVLDPHNIVTLTESERRLRFLDALFSETRALSQPGEIMQVTSQRLGQHLRVNRCAYAQVDDEGIAEVVGGYNDGVQSLAGRFPFAAFGEEVLRRMRADLPYVNEDVDVNPLTAGRDLTAYRAIEIRALICVPLHKQGRLVAAMAVHQRTPRLWTPEEVALVREVVGRCWESLERIRSERVVRDMNQRMNLALSAANLGDWSWVAATDDVTLSERSCAIFGVSAATLTWTQLRERLHPDDRENARLAVEEAAAKNSEYTIQYRVLREGEPPRWVSAKGQATFAEDGSLLGMNGIVQDVTAWRQAEELARNEAQTLEILNRTGASLAAQLDLRTLLQRATDAATELTGAEFGAFFYNGTDEQGEAYLLYTLSGAPRSAFETFGHPRPTTLFGPTFRGEPPIRSDDILRDPRYGQWGPHHGMPPKHLPVRSYLAVPVIGRQGEVLGGLFFGHSSTSVFTMRSERLAVGVAAQTAIAIDNARLYAEAQRAAEERSALLESERSARKEAERANTIKDEFLATLSHELRTPLNAILGWAHILRRKLKPEQTEMLKGVDVIERSTRVQTQLIEDLLDMSRITSGKLRLDVRSIAPIAFVEPAVETVRPAAEAAQVRIETFFDASAGAVSGDLGRLQQVVWNLLANAVKFTPRGGRVRVHLTRVDEHVEITVADTGVGIKPEFLPFIFDRFRQADGSITRRFGGIGLGLSIVKHLVELHGGRVFVSSAGEGSGATFVVQLPVTAAHATPETAGAHSEPPAQGLTPVDTVDLAGLKVLVVDDEESARDLLRRLLEDCGAVVRLADGAEAALAAVQDERPDVIVSDIGMPVVDGYELLRRVRALTGDGPERIPAVALTAFARPEDRVRALRAGFSVHVSKPVEPSELLATVASLAGRQLPQK